MKELSINADDVVYRFELDERQRYASISDIYTDKEEVMLEVGELPAWMVSQLNMLRRLPPAKNGIPTKGIKGVGRRISSTAYWIVKPPNEKEIQYEES